MCGVLTAHGYAIRANISPKKKTGSSKLKLASKCEKKKQKTQENRKQTLRQNRRKKQIETNTPSLVGMNVVNLGEQKFQGEERRGKQTNEEAEERKRERESEELVHKEKYYI